MKNKIVKITKDYYGFIKNMTDKQRAEFISTVCERVYDGKPLVTKDKYLKGVYVFVERDLQVAAQNSINGKKGAEVLAERKREMQPVELIVGSVIVTAKTEGNE